MPDKANGGAALTSTRLAALQMYDFEYIHDANNQLWQAIARLLVEAGIDNVPQSLTRAHDIEAVWLDPQLLLAQTCGLPIVKTLAGKVKLVATPCYSCQGCAGPNTTSAIVVRKDNPAKNIEDLRGSDCVFNQTISNSGMNVLRAVVAPIANGKPFFQSVTATGSHFASLTAVVEQEADVTAIDCVTLAHIKTFAPYLVSAVKIINWTKPSAGLPLITSLSTDDHTLEALRCALQAVASDPSLNEVREALFLTGFSVLTESDYEPIRQMELEAAKLGYAELK